MILLILESLWLDLTVSIGGNVSEEVVTMPGSMRFCEVLSARSVAASVLVL